MARCPAPVMRSFWSMIVAKTVTLRSLASWLLAIDPPASWPFPECGPSERLELWLEAEGDIVITLDGDLQHPPSLFPKCSSFGERC